MKTINTFSGCCVAICLMAFQTGLSNAADSIHSIFAGPSGSVATKEPAVPFKCPQIVRPMLDMSGMFAFYKPDKTQSVIDKEKMQAYVKKTWPTIQVKKSLSETIAAAVTSPANAVAARACIVRQADVWATSNAMLQGLEDNDPLGHRQAALVMIWTGITFANALQVTEHVSPLPPDQQLRLRKWFGDLSREIQLNFAIKPREPKDAWLNANSNQRLWAGAAVGLMAAETGDRAALNWAFEVLKGSLKDMDADGSMPSEMWRGTKALHYQNFALQAASIIVSLADANHLKLSANESKSLTMAARFALSAYQHPETFKKAKGLPQERGNQLMSWTGPMSVHFQGADKKLAGQLAQEFIGLGSDTLIDCQSTCNPYYDRLLRSQHKR